MGSPRLSNGSIANVSKLTAGVFIASFLLIPSLALCADYFVSPSGSDSNNGSMTSPFRSLPKAYSLASAGTTIYLRGGVYSPTSRIVLNKSGTSANPIRVFAYEGETPIIDGTNESEQWRSLLEIPGSFNHVRGLEVRNASNTGVAILGSGQGNILEKLNVHHSGRVWEEGNGIVIYDSSSNNLILNCDSHHNRSVRNVGNSDGIRQSGRGLGNILRGNRAYRNSDDGFDLWNGAPTLLEGNIAYENGYDDSFNRLGDGNGFKLGGNHSGYTSGGHTLRNNVAFRNPLNGFDYNTGQGAFKLYNNTAYMNGPVMPGGGSWGENFVFSNSGDVFRNNLSYQGGQSLKGDDQSNSWSLSVSVTDADFLSLDDSALRGPRTADGSLPTSNFLRLASSSDLINKGVNVGLPYSGSAPDLGAYEAGTTVSPTPTPTPTPAPTPQPTPAPTPQSTPSGVNLLKNPGFENGGTSWTDWGNTRVTSENIHSGQYALRVGTGEGGRGQVVQGIQPGATYVLSVNAKVPSARDEQCYIGFTFRDANGRSISSPSPSLHALSGGWATSTLRASAKAPPNAVSVSVWVWKDATSGFCYVDSFNFFKQ